MAIKGLVGKDGNTLGTPEKPWNSIYVDNIGGAFLKPDFDKKKELTYKVTKYGNFNYYVFEPFPENGFCRMSFSINSYHYLGILYDPPENLIITKDILNYLLHTAGKSGETHWVGAVRKGTSALGMIPTSTTVGSTSWTTALFYPFLKE